MWETAFARNSHAGFGKDFTTKDHTKECVRFVKWRTKNGAISHPRPDERAGIREYSNSALETFPSSCELGLKSFLFVEFKCATLHYNENPIIPPAMIGPKSRAETTTTFGPDCPFVFLAMYTMLGITETPAPTTAPITAPKAFPKKFNSIQRKESSCNNGTSVLRSYLGVSNELMH